MNPAASNADGRPAPALHRTRLRSAGADAVSYDFRRPIQLSREHQRHLQVAFDGFARQATTTFTSALRTICQVTLGSIDQRTYAEYVDSLPATTYLSTFTADPLPGVGILELPLNAVMACVDHMLGGPGGDEQPSRSLTEIEGGIVGGLVERVLAGLCSALTDIVAVRPVVTGVEYNPQFAQAAGHADVEVVVSLELKIGERSHAMTVCLPFNALLPHLATAAAPAPVSPRERAQKAASADLLTRQFQQVPLSVAVRFRSTRLNAEIVGDLKPGDVLRLGHPASAPLDVTVDETVFAHATPGTHGPRLAALIVSTPQEIS